MTSWIPSRGGERHVEKGKSSHHLRCARPFRVGLPCSHGFPLSLCFFSVVFGFRFRSARLLFMRKEKTARRGRSVGGKWGVCVCITKLFITSHFSRVGCPATLLGGSIRMSNACSLTHERASPPSLANRSRFPRTHPCPHRTASEETG